MFRRQKIVLSPLTTALMRQGLAKKWYRWCNSHRDWSTEATTVHADDSLLNPSGTFAPLTLAEFMQAFRTAGADVSTGSPRWEVGRKRSFTVEVREGTVVSNLGIQLGRGLNSMECSLELTSGGEATSTAELLHTCARDILVSRRKREHSPPYPRPIIGSRSQLEVVARELVAMLRAVAREWDPDARRP